MPLRSLSLGSLILMCAAGCSHHHDADRTASTGSGPVASSDSSGNASPTASTVVAELVGQGTSDVIVRAQEVATFRIDAKHYDPNLRDAPDRFDGYPILSTGPKMDAAFGRRAASLFLSDATYVRNIDKNMCRNDVAVGLRFEAVGERVDLLLLFPCCRVAFLRRASADTVRIPGEYFDPAKDQIARLVQDAFPQDPAVSSLP